jgi:hypothetical protein
VSGTPLRLEPADFDRLLGRPAGCSPGVLSNLGLPDLLYRQLDDAERARTLADVEEAIETRRLRTVGADDPAVWEKGWGELADALQGRPVTLESLRPQYFHANVPCRLFGRFVQPVTPDFEYWAGVGVRQLIFDEFLGGWKSIVEFGCGTGINLLLLARLLPNARLTGCDWASASQRILAAMGRQTDGRVVGRSFNMLTASGWDGREIGPTTAVLTVHALEQLSDGWQPFLDYLLARRPGFCLHVEPLVELYDGSQPYDDLARRYHMKRRYLQGFLPAIQTLAASGKAEILALRRVPFGGLYHEAYAVLAWRLL